MGGKPGGPTPPEPFPMGRMNGAPRRGGGGGPPPPPPPPPPPGVLFPIKGAPGKPGGGPRPGG